jgi:F-type H+-transporting ATPase subunit gamma
VWCFNSNVIGNLKKRAEFYAGVQVDIFAIGKRKRHIVKTNSVVDDQRK